jgi:hypothetical protein
MSIWTVLLGAAPFLAWKIAAYCNRAQVRATRLPGGGAQDRKKMGELMPHIDSTRLLLLAAPMVTIDRSGSVP